MCLFGSKGRGGGRWLAVLCDVDKGFKIARGKWIYEGRFAARKKRQVAMESGGWAAGTHLEICVAPVYRR